MKRLGLIFLFFVGIIVQIQSQTEVTPEHDVMQIVNQFKRPVLNRTEKDKGAYSEIIFHLKEGIND